jgi:hypothetical protein
MVRAGTAEVFMIRNMRGMVSVAEDMCDQIEAGGAHKFAGSDDRTPEP